MRWLNNYSTIGLFGGLRAAPPRNQTAFVRTSLVCFITFVLMFAFAVNHTHALGRKCTANETYSLAIHGGAVWGNQLHPKKEAFILKLLEKGRAHLSEGNTSLDLVETVVAEMEDSGLFNAGKGGVANRSGEVELDASIMDGKHLRAGSVAGVRRMKNPVSAARSVMDNTAYVMMTGPGADEHLMSIGNQVVEQSYFDNSGDGLSKLEVPDDLTVPVKDPSQANRFSDFVGVWAGVLGGRLQHLVVLKNITEAGGEAHIILTANESIGLHRPVSMQASVKVLGDFLIVSTDRVRVSYRLKDSKRVEARLTISDGGRVAGELVPRPELLKRSGTVGAVAYDRCGNLAAATSTGGFNSKIPGRVGDSAVIGAGTYADNKSVAVSATGHGEYFIRHSVAHQIAARVRHGKQSLIKAAYQVIYKELGASGGLGGIIAISKTGEVVMIYNTDGMVRGRTTESFGPKVETYSSD